MERTPHFVVQTSIREGRARILLVTSQFSWNKLLDEMFGTRELRQLSDDQLRQLCLFAKPAMHDRVQDDAGQRFPGSNPNAFYMQKVGEFDDQLLEPQHPIDLDVSVVDEVASVLAEGQLPSVLGHWVLRETLEPSSLVRQDSV